MNRYAVLFHQENLIFRCDPKNDGDASCIDPIHVFPLAFFDQRQELARMQDCANGSVQFAIHEFGVVHHDNACLIHFRNGIPHILGQKLESPPGVNTP